MLDKTRGSVLLGINHPPLLKTEYGVDPVRYDSRQELLTAMQERDG
jgi:hypothetical protein